MSAAAENREHQDYEYQPLRLPPDVSRVTASLQLAIQAEYGGWELSRVRLYSDGTRRVVLRRRRSSRGLPGPAT
ncbi:MAG: DUF5703 family protein [Mycobacteriaceae bacterium]